MLELALPLEISAAALLVLCVDVAGILWQQQTKKFATAYLRHCRGSSRIAVSEARAESLREVLKGHATGKEFQKL